MSAGGGGDDSDFEEHDEGEPWLVSYADMMTLLFGFFVLMYSFALARASPTKDTDDWVKVRKEIAAYFTGESAQENETEAGRAAGLVDSNIFRPLLNLAGFLDSTPGLQEEKKRTAKVVFEKKQAQLRAIAQEADTARLRAIAAELEKESVAQGSALEVPPAPAEGAEKDYVLAFAGERMFDMTVEDDSLKLSAQSEKALDRLADAARRIGNPLRFSVESYMDPASNPRALEMGEKLKAFGLTSSRATTVLEVLLRKVGKGGKKRHIYSAVGYGYLDPSLLGNQTMKDRVIIRVSLLADK